MPDPMTERQGPPAPDAAPKPEAGANGLEILKPESYGLYGRILLASQVPEDQVADYLNPDKTSADWPQALPTGGTRDYSPITHQLSSLEREHAWRDADRADAFNEWKTKFTKFATTTKDEHKANVIGAISGKSAADLTEDDTAALYDKFCKDKSNSTAFVDSIVQGVTEGDKVSAEKLATLMPHIEWLASKFFGTETAKVVGKMVELEAQMRNEPDKAFNVLLIDESTKRVDKLNDSEKEMLGKVYKSFEGATITSGPTAIPEADATAFAGGEPGTAPLPEPAEDRIRTIEEAIAAVKRGETPINPATGQPLLALSQDHAIHALENQLADAKAAATKPETPETEPDEDDDVLAAPLPAGTPEEDEDPKYEHSSDVDLALETLIGKFETALDEADDTDDPTPKQEAWNRAEGIKQQIIKLTANRDAVDSYTEKMDAFISKLITEDGLQERFDQDQESLFKDRPDVKQIFDNFMSAENNLYTLAENNPDALSSIPDPIDTTTAATPDFGVWDVPGQPPRGERAVAPGTQTGDEVLPGTFGADEPQGSPTDWWTQGFHGRPGSEPTTEEPETEPEEQEPTNPITGQTTEERKGQISAGLDASHGQQSVSFDLDPNIIADKLRDLAKDKLTKTGELSVDLADGSIILRGLELKNTLPFQKIQVVNVTLKHNPEDSQKFEVTTTGGNAEKIGDQLQLLSDSLVGDFQALTQDNNPTWKAVGVDVSSKGRLIVRYASVTPLHVTAESVADLDQPAVLQEAPEETPPNEDTTI